MKVNWKWIFVSILLLLLFIFTVQNYEVVKIQFLFWSFKTSRALIILLTLLIGMAIGWVLSVIKAGQE